ncbi:MerR family transcriptional regulator [Mucilaginibacter sp. BJC16-A38]|uniref:MerR family transcriptional regulator n=1 Tax=Mucilaginibacter phenanthrenivorans TaxID=1234842 RepID=UPI0021579CA1|nr:MerR family transcriptional regulator [Mucilaginibacter phenanthrenivorans]MCR8560224.1 MerR family transcriptional regulator [Mucilaginibacter phenanthrenivorans]
MKDDYSVKQLAKLAGVSVRTLHLYDKLNLLNPSIRTESRYRRYGEKELLRLQQILFYKVLDFPLKEIGPILDDPDFDLVKALEGHKESIITKRDHLTTLLQTIDKTVDHLKNKTMSNYEELYEGMPKEEAEAYRNEAVEKWGEAIVLRSEKALLEMPKLNLGQLKADQKDIAGKLVLLVNENPESGLVQEQIARHYANIRSFWGVSDPTDLKIGTYKGLADLYVADDRYTTVEGKTNPVFAAFMYKAMMCFADSKLK